MSPLEDNRRELAARRSFLPTPKMYLSSSTDDLTVLRPLRRASSRTALSSVDPQPPQDVGEGVYLEGSKVIYFKIVSP